MNRIEEMIKEMCPDGVETIQIKKVSVVGTGSSNRQDAVDNGCYPFFVRSKDVLSSNQYEYDEEAILIPGEGGIGEIFHYYKGKYALHQRTYRIHITNNNILTKFVYYYMFANFKSFILKKAVTGSVASIRKPMIEDFEIPLPPPSIQQEIVKILDSFTALQQNLEDELKLRQKQYEHYREKLLTFEDSEVEWKKLGEVADTLSGNPFNSSKFTKSGVRLMRGMNVKRGYLDFNEEDDRYWESSNGLEKFLLEENDIIISMDGSLVGKSFAMLEKKHLPLLLVQRVARVRSKKVNTQYIYQCIKKDFPDYVEKKKTAGAIPHVSMKDIDNFIVPIPSLEKQSQITQTLDHFESLISNIKTEIELRKKQYEYYREKLLTF